MSCFLFLFFFFWCFFNVGICYVVVHMYVPAVINILECEDSDFSQTNSMHNGACNITHALGSEWAGYFRFFAQHSDLHYRANYHPNVSKKQFDYSLPLKLQTTWFRKKCHAIHFGLWIVIKYCCGKYHDLGDHCENICILFLLELIKLLVTTKLVVEYINSIYFTPGNDNGTLQRNDVAYGVDCSSREPWYLFTFEV